MSAIDDLEADIRNLKVLVDVTTEMMIDCNYGDHKQMVADAERNISLMWIIRNWTGRSPQKRVGLPPPCLGGKAQRRPSGELTNVRNFPTSSPASRRAFSFAATLILTLCLLS